MSHTFLNHLHKEPFLVQRMKRRDRPGEGVDAHFEFDYMGAAEFEWGTLPEALKLMRGWPTMSEWEPTVIRLGLPDHPAHVAWFVGPVEALELTTAFFIDQLTERKRRLKERSHLFEVYHPEPRNSYAACTGWWALDAWPCPWVLFREREDAEQWLKDLRKPK